MNNEVIILEYVISRIADCRSGAVSCREVIAELSMAKKVLANALSFEREALVRTMFTTKEVKIDAE